jgi:hypothetical protein
MAGSPVTGVIVHTAAAVMPSSSNGRHIIRWGCQCLSQHNCVVAGLLVRQPHPWCQLYPLLSRGQTAVAHMPGSSQPSCDGLYVMLPAG